MAFKSYFTQVDTGIFFVGMSYLHAHCFSSLSVYPGGLRINLLEAPLFLVCASVYDLGEELREAWNTVITWQRKKGNKRMCRGWLSASEFTQWNMDSLNVFAICFFSNCEQFQTPHAAPRLIEFCMLLVCSGYQGERISTEPVFARAKRISH